MVKCNVRGLADHDHYYYRLTGDKWRASWPDAGFIGDRQALYLYHDDECYDGNNADGKGLGE